MNLVISGASEVKNVQAPGALLSAHNNGRPNRDASDTRVQKRGGLQSTTLFMDESKSLRKEICNERNAIETFIIRTTDCMLIDVFKEGENVPRCVTSPRGKKFQPAADNIQHKISPISPPPLPILEK
ncbi:hypothetical protein C0J52_06879 [Blattella germanica]|nr:hypothetical protein C0J52_06879 [Blattella germanica]